MTGEYFTSPDYYPIRNLAANSKNGVVQDGWGWDCADAAVSTVLVTLHSLEVEGDVWQFIVSS